MNWLAEFKSQVNASPNATNVAPHHDNRDAAGQGGGASAPPPNGSAAPSGHTGFSSDKQKGFFERLLTDKGVSAEARGTIVLWATTVPTQHISTAIDKLKEGNEEVVPRLISASEEWAAKQSDVPADTTDLPPLDPMASVGPADSDVPF